MTSIGPALLGGSQQALKPEPAQWMGEITDLLCLWSMRLRVMHTMPDTLALLNRAQGLTEAATHRAAASANSPACPKYGDRMIVKDIRTGRLRLWGCTNFPDCREMISLYSAEE